MITALVLAMMQATQEATSEITLTGGTTYMSSGGSGCSDLATIRVDWTYTGGPGTVTIKSLDPNTGTYFTVATGVNVALGTYSYEATIDGIGWYWDKFAALASFGSRVIAEDGGASQQTFTFETTAESCA